MPPAKRPGAFLLGFYDGCLMSGVSCSARGAEVSGLDVDGAVAGEFHDQALAAADEGPEPADLAQGDLDVFGEGDDMAGVDDEFLAAGDGEFDDGAVGVGEDGALFPFGLGPDEEEGLAADDGADALEVGVGGDVRGAGQEGAGLDEEFVVWLEVVFLDGAWGGGCQDDLAWGVGGGEGVDEERFPAEHAFEALDDAAWGAGG